MLPHPAETPAADHDRDDVVAVKKLAATFAALGRSAFAESLDALVHNLLTRSVADRPLPVPPGWTAVTYLAALANNSPSLPQVGDQVRVTFPDYVVTGLWMYQSYATADDEFPGRIVIVDDETGVPVEDFTEATGVEVVRMGGRVNGWERHLAEAALVIRSAWTSASAADVANAADWDPLRGCYGCTPDVDPAACSHTTGCTCDDCWQRGYERPRFCACGAATRYTVTAWSPIPQYAAEVGVDEDKASDAVALHKPGISGMNYVCSEPCARTWIGEFKERAVDRLPAADLAAMLYEMQPWTITPSRREVPAVLDRLRTRATATGRIAAGVNEWIPGANREEPRSDRFRHLHENIAHLVAAAVEIPSGTAVAHLWPESVQQVKNHPDEQPAELALALRKRVDADPGRYQVGARVVFDRVGQTYLCPACDVGVFTMPPNLRATLSLDVFGMKKSCPSCSAVLLP